MVRKTAKECSVLVNTCDEYEDAWNPFFYFLHKYWECPYDIYLNTETKKCSINDVITLNSENKEMSWSLRLKKALKRIDSKYIIFFLEDFFLEKPVDQAEIDRCIGIMNDDKKIAVIDFKNYGPKHSFPTEYAGYNQRDDKSTYCLNCQTALWRRKDLIRFLSKYESPWQFEVFGTERSKLYNKHFLISNDKNGRVFFYNYCINDGYGLYRGKWLKSNVKLFEDNGIIVDFGKMGFYDGKNVNVECIAPKKTIKEKGLYLLYGGGENVRTSVKEQMHILFKNPKKYSRMIKRKIRYCFSEARDV